VCPSWLHHWVYKCSLLWLCHTFCYTNKGMKSCLSYSQWNYRNGPPQTCKSEWPYPLPYYIACILWGEQTNIFAILLIIAVWLCTYACYVAIYWLCCCLCSLSLCYCGNIKYTVWLWIFAEHLHFILSITVISYMQPFVFQIMYPWHLVISLGLMVLLILFRKHR